MGLADLLVLAFTHPDELKSVIGYKLWYEPRNLNDDLTASRLDQSTMARCWELLDETSRSFSMVIKELDGELCRVVCLFYLVLRALDTIEDDMTLDIDVKGNVLQSFHEKLTQPGWTFTQSGPDEKDRDLLCEFDKVITEFQVLDKGYQTVISDITKKMGGGMARFARTAHSNDGIFSVDTLPAFDLYCHYVAGLVGEGLSRLFSSSGKESSELGQQLSLSNSMGLLLQKTNILRDFKEDVDDGRMFWPKEIWGKYVSTPEELCKVENKEKAVFALSEMTLDALTHATDSLEYLSLLKNQSVFNFCAVPQVMAIATLELCFGNLQVFERNVKIRRSLTLHLISRATNPRDLSYIFVEFAHKIHSRILVSDPSYIKLSICLSQIITWAESRYPSWVQPGQHIPTYRSDPETRLIASSDVRVLQQPIDPEVASGRKTKLKSGAVSEMEWEDWKLFGQVIGSVLALVVLISLGIGLVVYIATRDVGKRHFSFTIPILNRHIEL